MSNTPHDKLFKSTFQVPAHMEGVLRTVLPPSLGAQIKWPTLRLESGTWVDQVLADRHADLVFSAELVDRELLIHVLAEHQSQEDPMMAIRAWLYLARLLDGWLSSQTTRPQRIPAVVAVVMYHGEQPWQGSTELLDLYDLPREVREDISVYLPRLRFIVDDLTKATTDELQQRAELTASARLVQGLLRDLRSATHASAVVSTWWRLADQAETEPSGLPILEAAAYYILTLVPEEDRPEVLEAMQQNISEAGQSAIRTAADAIRDEGRAEATITAKAEAVLSVFAARHIQVSDDARQRIVACQDVTQLEQWLRRAAIASSVGEIFDV